MRVKEWLGSLYDGIINLKGIGHLQVTDAQTDRSSLIRVTCYICHKNIYEMQVKNEITSSFTYSQTHQGCRHTAEFIERFNTANATFR